MGSTCSAVHIELVQGLGYVARGTCGERLEFGAGVVLCAEDMPADACDGFRSRMLRTFGIGGSRRLPPEEQPEPYDGYGGLGRNPTGIVRGGF